MYGINVGLSPTDLERYDISAGAVSAVVDSPYHGDYRMCGDLWISKDGTRIFTGCGTVFRAAPGTKDDFLYNGSFEGGPCRTFRLSTTSRTRRSMRSAK
jgi:hypothetical protein